MSVLDFPTSPTNGQYYGGYIWNSSNETWDSAYAPRAATIPISSPNVVINGGFDILQRAQSYTITGSHFSYRTADRWILSCTASGATNIVNSINAFPDTGAIDGQDLRFFMRSNVTSVGTATAYGLVSRIEDVRTLAGRTATLSFWVRGTQNTTISPFLIQHFGTGGSSDVSIAGANQTITTSWQRKVITFTLPSVTGKTINNDNSFLQVQLNFNAVTLGTLDIAGVQLEGGDVATDFRRAGGTLQGELDACQRYFEQRYFYGTGWGQNSTQVRTALNYYTLKRATPGISFISGQVQYGPGGTLAILSNPGAEIGRDGLFITYTMTGGPTVNLPSITAALLAVNAEL